MYQAAKEDGRQLLAGRSSMVSAVFAGDEKIADARDLALSFLADLPTVHGLPVSERVTDTVELVVSELVTNARKHAPGPYVLGLEACDGAVEVSVWDSQPTLPTIQAPDPHRIGRHGLEIVTTLCRSFEIHREPVGKRIKAAVALSDDWGTGIGGPRAV
ncbi:ATP-binding protein [Streptomyces sp. A1136]|uniref:ATP-binding protein n=1 Tax=Streptomyces sp. A1136 TaxID=2563102 RepID=UPI001F0E23C6|nr:ATP-binding protein [Streptomyces sp. A1136]